MDISKSIPDARDTPYMYLLGRFDTCNAIAMSVKLLRGDCRDILPTLPAESVHCVVSSPPYWGLRDYGTGQWDGGDSGCDHKQRQPHTGNPAYTNGQTSKGYITALQAWGNRDVSSNYRDVCGKCGARRVDRQIGLEATPEEWVAAMVAVFREVRRVLRNDGVMFLNVGDSYAAGGTGGAPSSKSTLSDHGADGRSPYLEALGPSQPRKVPVGLKPKDLMLLPARLALALQADGWWVRSDIIWAKPNPMPESVTDRPMSAYEHVFLLTRSARYFYDADAVREPHADWRDGHNTTKPRSVQPEDPFGVLKWNPGRNEYNPAGRSCRNVWTVATEAFPSAHFATFPTALVERCLRAGTSERGCCATCGAPWYRVASRLEPTPDVAPSELDRFGTGEAGVHRKIGGVYQKWLEANPKQTTGWAPSCTCDLQDGNKAYPDPPVPCTVLDPFAGAGTTLLVADRLQRDAIGIELSAPYTAMAEARVVGDAPLFAWADAQPAMLELAAD